MERSNDTLADGVDTSPGYQVNLLIVDDERCVREGCSEGAQLLGFKTFTAENADQAYRALEAHDIDVVLLDLRMPGASGMEVLQQIHKRKPSVEIIVITGYATVQSAVQAMRMGVYDYVTKPFNLAELNMVFNRVSNHLKAAQGDRLVRERLQERWERSAIIGDSPEMQALCRVITKAANSTHSVLIQGESGTGKELVARAIHFSGAHRDKPFIPVDCGSLVPTLIESELFGHVRGAFTGAERSKEGLLTIADGGTVFLDEIGELPVDLQAKLLRALQEKEVRPVGSTRCQPINARIVAATNRDLEEAVQEGTFRKDLYFRLNVLNLRIPSLRERRSDIALLVARFIDRLARSTGIQRTISEDALRLMAAYDWPGNVRELENCLERAWAFSSGPVIQVSDLPNKVQETESVRAEGAVASGPKAIVRIAEMEKHAILTTISQFGGDKLMAARLLGIGKTTLYRKLKEYGVAG